ncbi:MAG: alpha/beta hydrolase, partial [Alphaproteobacteria bacterium]|nr:alpha/beta hydrolase [Alphaproteobacteria bacterium]
PYISVAERAGEMFFWLPARRLVTDRFDSASRVATIAAPLLVVHGARDTLIPIAHGRILFDAAKPPKTFVELPDRGHGDMAGPEFEAGLVEFLGSLALSRPAP